MSLDVLNDRKKVWKASQADYDDVFSRSNRLCSVCLTEQQITALLSMTEFLYWPTRWVKASGEVDRWIVEEFAERLERNLMMACCDDNLPIQYRYSDEGVLERSLNAGGNWTSAPEYDPRVYSPTFPPIPGTDGDDKKCIAASGAAALVKEQVGDQITDDMTRYTLSQLISDWVSTMIGSSNPFQALMTVITNQIFALVLSALRPALTDAVYDTFKCIIYCHLADDATVNLAEWQAMRSDITDQIGGIAGIFLEHLVYLLGTGGMTNLVRAGGASSGDCSTCECGGCAAGWISGYYYGGTGPFHTDAVISRTETSITIQAWDRGDGEFTAYATGLSIANCCHVEFSFDPPETPIRAKSLTDCATVPDYNNMVENDLWGGGDCTSCSFLGGTSTWTVTLTITDPT